MLQKSEAIPKLNSLGSSRTPFSFYCDFLGEHWCIEEEGASSDPVPFKLKITGNGDLISNESEVQSTKYEDPHFEKKPIPLGEFKKSFNKVVGEINIGNSFLTNLTFQTPIETNLSLGEIFDLSSAKYRLLVDEKFVVFSPETFVKIRDDKIYSYPMKGTIDASLPDAREILLQDPKEVAEHVTIVDLIRNDLSQVAENVEVAKFRYIDEIETQGKNLLQVSSEISGDLPTNWNEHLGSILSSLLPAGSISGAPKKETIRIIQETENYDRSFYTGICGRFDGQTLDTGVMIRFIKKERNKLYYCSGGGITSFSKAEKEYEEMVDKVYLPASIS